MGKNRLQSTATRCFFIVLALAICTAVTYRYAGGTGPAAETTSAARIDLHQVEPGWWESGRRIYFDIPARVLFRMEKDPDQALAVAEKAWAEFERIGRVFNPYDPDSEVARLNASPTTEVVEVSADLWSVLQTSRRLWRASHGAFDPTMLPIKRLWQDAVEKQQAPSARMIQATLGKVGFAKVRLLESRQSLVVEKRGMQFDFGGVAKGYAVDRVKALLRRNGVSAGLVQLGGEIAAFGERDGKPWRIGIQDPKQMAAVWGILTARSHLGVSTSGNYQQPLVIGGHSFYHIFHPKTGTPVSEKILGVTTADVSGNISNAMLDGAATAITVMGSEAGRKMAEALGFEILLLKETEGVPTEIMTDGFRKHYEAVSR